MSGWSRRSFLASAGTLATAGGAGATVIDRGEPRQVRLLSTYVAGAERSVVREVKAVLRPGTELRLMREPDNDYDSRAVAVLTKGGRRLGYIPRVENQAVANLMDAGLSPRAAVTTLRADASRPDIRINVSLAMV